MPRTRCADRGETVRKLRKTAMVGLCLVLGAAMMPMAQAQPIPALSDQLTYEIAGRVSPRCELDQFERHIDLGSLNDTATGGVRATQAQTSLRIDCNAPFSVSFASRNGGLAHHGRGHSDGFLERVAYTVSMDLARGELTRRAPCRSERMNDDTPCLYAIADTGGDQSIARVSLRVASDARPLAAGRFSDQLQMRVSPLIGGEEIAASIE